MARIDAPGLATSEDERTTMASTLLSIAGMTCGHCRQKVEGALKGVSGVLAVVVDLAEGAAEVEYDEGRTDATALVAAVEAAGYGASTP